MCVGGGGSEGVCVWREGGSPGLEHVNHSEMWIVQLILEP